MGTVGRMRPAGRGLAGPDLTDRTGNSRVFTLLLKCYLLPLANNFILTKCRHVSLFCNDLSYFYLYSVVF